jgi:hypothetical protein
MVQVHHDEGVANRIDPESCAAAREGISEALTGERTGQPLSRESTLFPDADVVPLTEGARHRERPDGPAWSQTLACADAPCAGTGRRVTPKRCQ